MSWNYRVLRHINEADGRVWFDIHEVYYNFPDAEGLSWTVKSKSPFGKTVEELRDDLKMMLEVLDLPVLEEKGDELVEVEK